MNQHRIPVCEPVIAERERYWVNKCLDDGWISGISPYVEDFENKFSEFSDSQYGVATNSGTTALHLALATLGVKKGDEVILPTFTMVATPNAVVYTGAKPVFIDAEPETWNINPEKIEEKITSKTKVIMPVHTYGHPADMRSVMEIADTRGIFVVEDAAEAHGAKYYGQKVGSFGEMGCFSFYANKIITTGEGGMITTNNEKLAERAKWLRAHAFGREGKHFWHEELGYGYRFSGLQAALGLAQLEQIETFIATRRRNAQLYNDIFTDMGLVSKGKITLPPEAYNVKNIYWMYSPLIEDNFGMSREELMNRLTAKGIETRTFFYPMHVQPMYAEDPSCYPVANSLAKRGINLPSTNNLSEEDVWYVAEAIVSAQRNV